MTESDLKPLFEDIGDIVELVIIRDRHTYALLPFFPFSLFLCPFPFVSCPLSLLLVIMGCFDCVVL